MLDKAVIRLAGSLDCEHANLHKVGPCLFAENDGSLEPGEWDLRMLTAENWLGTDRGEGIPCLVLFETGGTSKVVLEIEDFDPERKEECTFQVVLAIDSAYVSKTEVG